MTQTSYSLAELVIVEQVGMAFAVRVGVDDAL